MEYLEARTKRDKERMSNMKRVKEEGEWEEREGERERERR